MHPFRTDRCGELDETDVGRRVRLSGWVANVRPLGGLAFALLRDSSGPIQIIASDRESVACLQSLKPGAVATVDGRVERRRGRDVNPQLRTGSVEVRLAALREWSGAAPADLHETVGPPEPGARAELLARNHLHEQGFTDVGDGARGPLAAFLPSHDRAFRVRTAGGAAGRRRLLEFESAFVTLDDLRAQVRDLVIAVSAALSPSPTEPLTTAALTEIPAITKGPHDAGPLQLVHGLPAAGLPALDGHDLRLTLLSEPDDAPPASWDTSQGPLAQCLLLATHGRLIGTGGVRRGDLGDLTHRHHGSLDADPLLREEILDLLRERRSPVPGEAWFILDLDRLADPVAVGEGSAEQVTSSPLFPHPHAIIQDLTALLCEADLTGAGPVLQDESDEAQAGRIERWDVEASAAMARSRTASPSPPTAPAGDGDPWAEHRDLLDDFSMDADVRGRLLEVVPGTAAHVSRLPAGERFDWVWSVLGSHRVRDLLRHDPSLAVVQRAAALGVITDARQLSYLDIPAVAHLATVLARYGHLGVPESGSRTLLVNCLRQVLAASPGGVTALLAALAGADDDTAKTVEEALAEGRADLLTSAAQTWLAAPGLAPLALRLVDEPSALGLLGEVARDVGGTVLPNVPFDAASLGVQFVEQVSPMISTRQAAASEADPEEIATGILHQIFRPISLTYAETRAVLGQVGDWHDHVPSAGLLPGGRHWAADRGCYEFRHITGSGGLRCYLSKNAPSALAKGSVGICTAQDLDLFRRSDHHHLNLVDATTGVVVGNAQLHLLTEGQVRVLLIRALNASNTYLTRHPARTAVEAVLVSCVELAATSGLDEVHLGEGLSFWHLNSSRPQIRAVLEQLYDRLPVVFLDPSFYLFRFGNVDLQIAKTYRLWARNPKAVDGFRLRHFVRAVV